MLTDPSNNIDLGGSWARMQRTRYIDVLVVGVYINVLLRYF